MDDHLKVFSRWPDLGGVLTIVNGLLWIALIAGRGGKPDEAISAEMYITLVIVLGLPIFLPLSFFVPLGFSEEGVFLMAFLIGLNAFAWGYGLAWFWSSLSWIWRNLLSPIRKSRGGPGVATVLYYPLLIIGLASAVLLWMYALTW
ncbi:MAG: hypothetical protein EA424_04515 [Planctomycetaceae bacterium]|nr:MAG: hypothetical protein EA424_04515 [Planctomycetaceae bacterium]